MAESQCLFSADFKLELAVSNTTFSAFAYPPIGISVSSLRAFIEGATRLAAQQLTKYASGSRPFNSEKA